MENLDVYKNVPKMKNHIIPQNFDCQQVSGKKRKIVIERSTNEKEIKQEVEDDIEEEIKIYKLDKSIVNMEGTMEQTSETKQNNIVQINPDKPINNVKNNIQQTIKKLIGNISTTFNSVPATTSTSTKENSSCSIYNRYHPIKNNIQDSMNMLPKIGCFDSHIKLMKSKSSFYIGIPEQYIFIVDLLSDKLQIQEQEIILCLKKIRRDVNCSTLANDFGMTLPSTTRCLCKLIPELSRYFKSYIFWPSSKKIIENLPRPFRKKFMNINSIIDCLEITIPEPPDISKRTQCWSSSRGNYTLKYLISYTPDGLINFVSGGFGGSTTDPFLIEISGYMDVVPSGVDIMINRGFFDVGYLFSQKGCKLYRPPNMKAPSNVAEYSTYLKETKETLALGIYTAQVIKRFRDFFITHPFTHIDNRMLPLIDDSVVIAAALMNLQNSVWGLSKRSY